LKKTIEQLAAEQRRAYQKKWRAANKEKTKKHQADYWKRRAERAQKEEQINETR